MPSLFEILRDIDSGTDCDSEVLVRQVYDEVHQLARAMIARESPGDTLQATALVHEVYLRLLRQFEGSSDDGQKDGEPTDQETVPANAFRSRAQFFGAAAEAMRRILIESARRKKRLKRGGDRNRIELHPDELMVNAPPDDLLALDEALLQLETVDKVKADVVKLRYFAGLSVEETAASLDISTATVKRYWAYSKAWLRREIVREGS